MLANPLQVWRVMRPFGKKTVSAFQKEGLVFDFLVFTSLWTDMV